MINARDKCTSGNVEKAASAYVHRKYRETKREIQGESDKRYS